MMGVNQYLAIFLDGAKEHLQNLNKQILTLESDPENAGIVHEIFRSTHLLKGMAGTMGYKRMQGLTGDMENVLSEVRSGNIAVRAEMIDLLFQCLSALEESIEAVQKTEAEGGDDHMPLRRQLHTILQSSRNAAAYLGKQTKGAQDRAAYGLPWNEIALESSQVKVIWKAGAQGKRVYGINVAVQDNCMLKAARAFMVFRAIEDKTEVIVSSPSAEHLEDEKFDEDFTLIVISDADLEGILAAIADISEISYVTGAPLELEKTKNYSETKAALEEAEREAAAERASHPAGGGAAALEKAAEAGKAVKGSAKESAAPSERSVLSRTVRVDLEKLDGLLRLTNELVMAQNALASALDGKGEEFSEPMARLEGIVAGLRESVMEARKIPIESVLNKFPRRTKDLARTLNKPIELYISGWETEIDRTVADKLGEPLMYLVKNAAEYGLESTAVRTHSGKHSVGVISLKAYQDADAVVIEVGDDGSGEVSFRPGISAARQTSAGGPAAAYAKIVALGGTLEVKSEPGKGSTWIVRLPRNLVLSQDRAADEGDAGLDIDALL